MPEPSSPGSTPPSGYRRFFAELKRRRVFRVMAVYGVVGFVLLQAADLAVPALLLPEWTYRLVALLLLVGFPVSVVLAWAFEVTPDGLQKTEKADPGEITRIVSAPVSRRWPVGFAAAAGAALLLFSAWFVVVRPGPDSADSGKVRAASIAVLPFGNLSGDPAAQPFADGLHDDLLTQLSKIGALTVISRTSVLEYRDSPKKVREIAGELGVATVLEGGVQRSGSRFRINVQMIDADTDAHLWAEQYDGELTAENIFEVQTRIATSIAGALASALTPGERERLWHLPSRDLEAWEAYREARRLVRELYEASGPAVAEQIDGLLELAIERDSTFAEPWALRSVLASFAFFMSSEDRSDSVAALADSLSRRALDLDPGLPEAHWARAHYEYRVRLDFDRALAEIEAALAGQPGDVDYLAMAGNILRRDGDLPAALARYERAAELDPRDGRPLTYVGRTLGLLRRYPEARRALEASRELLPARGTTLHELALLAVLARGDTAEARARLDEAHRLEIYNPHVEFADPEVEMLSRRPDAAIRAIREWPGPANDNQFRYAPAGLAIGRALLLSGDTAAARVSFEAARAELARLVDARPTEARFRSALGLALAGLGRNEEAVRAAEEGTRLLPVEREHWIGAWRVYERAAVYAMTGRTEAAVADLAFLLSIPFDLSPALLRIDPTWDPLRGDPDFAALAAGDQVGRRGLNGTSSRGRNTPD